jgi:hypothetical protein
MRVEGAGSRRHMPGSSGKLVEQSPTTGAGAAPALRPSVPRIGRPYSLALSARVCGTPSDAQRNFTARGQRGLIARPGVFDRLRLGRGQLVAQRLGAGGSQRYKPAKPAPTTATSTLSAVVLLLLVASESGAGIMLLFPCIDL